jgi:RHS repeat-associated protein
VRDADGATTFTNDIDNQNTANYKYDKTGNLIEDVSESTRIHWTYYNKVKQIDSVKLTPPKYGLILGTKLRMKYDALGNRVVKEVPKKKQKEIYVRDAQGNILALYEVKSDSLYTKEFYMYGSNRLGYFEDEVFLGRKCIGKFCNIVANPANPMPFIGTQKTLPTLPPVVIQPISSSSVSVVFGKKRYELSDWLGNVRVVINDRKTPINSGNVTVGYKAQVINVNDYYSFGSEIDDRTYTYNTPYRFSFNGKEDIRDQRWYQDYGARWYNKVLGRFISADPIIITEKKYPWYSSYQFAGNKPINSIDLDGFEPEIMIDKTGRVTKPFVSLLNASFGFDKKSIENTKWISYETNFISRLWALVVGIPNKTSASIMGSIVVHDADKNRSDKEWFSLIVHEQVHKTHVESMGNLTFYSNYIIEGIKVPYENITTEKIAYEYGGKKGSLADQLYNYKGGIIMSILYNPKLTDEIKSIELEKIGYKFRRDVVIPNEVKKINSMIEDAYFMIKYEKSLTKDARYMLEQFIDKAGKYVNKLEKESKEITEKYGK